MKMRLFGRCALPAALLLATGAVHAQTIGPDVVVSDAGGVGDNSASSGDNVRRYGTVNGITGYAVRSVSCNIGDQDAIWIDLTSGANGNQHPVIATNMFRYRTEASGVGRFEQIGMSWLKHGWCAADGGTCTSLASANPETPGAPVSPRSNGSCDWLGLYYNDTYSSGLNGDQADLGPRSDVNPWTGVFPYPYTRAWNQTGDAIFKRLQIANADMDPANFPNAQFYSETLYIATDERPERRINNASYRRQHMYTTGTGASTVYNFRSAIPGTSPVQHTQTVPLRAAIEAWKVIDPTVSLVKQNVPNDGRFIVAGKATDLGNGLWDYEYAVYNMNSHRGAAMVSIPAPCGVNVSNAGFKDVNYHSGEQLVYDQTDWVSGKTVDAVVFQSAPVPVGSTLQRNALRWSTMYNFRFVSDAAPVTGAMTLGLNLAGGPGDPDSIQIAGLPVPGGPACPGNFNGDGATNSADIQDFLNAWFADRQNATTAADFNCSGATNSTDIQEFLNAWFLARQSGCF